MSGPYKWLFAVLFLAGGILLGIQIGNWTGPKKAPSPAAKVIVKRVPAAAPSRPAVSKPSIPAPVRPVPATDPSAQPRRVFSAAPKVAIVLDDWGYNTKALQTALAIREPLTIAVLPHLPFSTEVAEKAHASGHEIMLHMPMEPLKPTGLEKGTIMSGMDAPQVRALLDSAIESVPYLRGVNNHMGSKITQDARILKIVMNDLQSRNLFFLNSMVTGSPVGRGVAGEVQIPYAERDVFLDNVRTEEAILRELENLKQTALRQGSAIGIGHDEPVTLRAIQKVLPSWRAEGIEVIKLSELIRYHSESA